MLFLLPPSETKRTGGTQPNISQVAQTFGTLTESRVKLIDELVKVSKKPKSAKKILKLSDRQLDELEHNANLWTAPTLPAIERYDGTLYDALDYFSLSSVAQQRARESVLIQSALFGLISAADRIPKYRLSATSNLPKINLRAFWSQSHVAVFNRLSGSQPIIDLRSKSYVELAPIPENIESYWVEVVARSATGEIRALNHFNKKSKGELLRAALQSDQPVVTLKDLVRVAKSLGFAIEQQPHQLLLVIPGN